MLKQLPAKIDFTERIPMAFEQQDLYDDLVERFSSEVEYDTFIHLLLWSWSWWWGGGYRHIKQKILTRLGIPYTGYRHMATT